MNDLYLIGNGFDLAHGLKTSYNDFLLWYLNNFLGQYRNKSYPNQHEDELLKIISGDSRYTIPVFDSISEMHRILKKSSYILKAQSDFFNKIIDSYRNYRWVDIEYEYYSALINWYKQVELNPQNRNTVLSVVINLNNILELIKNKLAEYLSNITISKQNIHKLIENILTQGTGAEGKDEGDKLYLNFNYTSTLKLYTEEFYFPKHMIINIHGELKNEDNPIIFGYGDEMDPHYEKLENLNSNDFLKNIKSFSYFKTDNYQKVIRFLENEFTVKILGHSCGLSDRILLNTIFEHPSCKAIKIFYYQKSETENDYFEKTQEISRHFKASSKGDMRNKIISFERCSPLLPYKNQN